MKRPTLLLSVGALLSAGCTPGWTGSGPEPMPVPQVSAAPSNAANFRVVESATGNTVPLAALVERASTVEVVFFGEEHDDPETHFLEFALLEGIGRKRDRVVLSLEMFERDVQKELDQYLSGAVSESTFLARSRPWPRYATDYRDMVQLARARGWPVVAANIPRPLASAIAHKGLQALDTLTSSQRMTAAIYFMCQRDAYFDRFAEAMGGHGVGGGPPTTPDTSAAARMTQLFYEAQCAKDETMGESIARQFVPPGNLFAMAPRGGTVRSVKRRDDLVFHVNGSFHSDYGQGTAERVRRRMPDIRSLIVTAMPVENPSTAVLGRDAAKADYVIFTRKP